MSNNIILEVPPEQECQVNPDVQKIHQMLLNFSVADRPVVVPTAIRITDTSATVRPPARHYHTPRPSSAPALMLAKPKKQAAKRKSVSANQFLTVPVQPIPGESRPKQQRTTYTSDVSAVARKYFPVKPPHPAVVCPTPVRAVAIAAPVAPAVEYECLIVPFGPNVRATSLDEKDLKLFDVYRLILAKVADGLDQMRADIASSYIPRSRCDVCHEDYVMIPGDRICKFCAYHLQKTNGKIEFDFYAERSDEEKIRLFGSAADFNACKEAFEKDPVNDHVKKCNMCDWLTRGKWNACRVCGSTIVKKGVLRLNRIIDGLFLTGCKVPPEEVAGHNIKQVVTVGKKYDDTEHKDHVPEVQIPDCPNATNLRLQLNDTPSDQLLLEDGLLDALEFIAKCKDSTVVHCQAGASRSASIVLAYMMLVSPQTSLAEAYCTLYRCRNVININMGFMDMLKRFKSRIDKLRAGLMRLGKKFPPCSGAVCRAP